MEPFHKHIDEYRKQLKRGAIQKAYRGLMEYIMSLRTYFSGRYPDHFVSGSIYYGYMDMTFFSFVPESLKRRKLKPAIVFVHEAFRFEIWLAAVNRKVQAEYRQLIAENGWNKYRLAPEAKGVDSIIEHVLVDQPDFSDLDGLTERIETGALQFIRDVEAFLSEH